MRWIASSRRPILPGEITVEGRRPRRDRSLAPERVDQLDCELTTLARGGGALRLRLGEVLAQLDPTELGFSSLGSFAEERLNRKGRWASDACVVARRLVDLPMVRAAVMDGTLGWSMAEVVGRAARAGTSEADEASLLDDARRLTVRQMKEQLKSGADDDDTQPPRKTVRIAVPIEDYWYFRASQRLVGAVAGTESHDQVIEALLAEGATSLQGQCPDVRIPHGPSPEVDPAVAAEMRKWCEQLAEMRRDGEVACEAQFAEVDITVGVHPLVEREMPGDAVGLDAYARELARDLDRRELTIGRLANELFRRPPAGMRTGWARLGFASLTQYAKERLRMSRSAVMARMTLARSCAALPVLGEWLEAGRVGFEAVQLVARISSRATVVAWLERAASRTFKHLREEVDAAELVARAAGSSALLVPPDKETLGAVQQLERRVLSQVRRVPPGAPGSEDGSAESEDTPVQMFGEGLPGGTGVRVIELRVREDLADFWIALRSFFERQVPGRSSFLVFLCDALWESWRDAVEVGAAYEDVYLRDSYRCANPTCRRRDVTPHHIVFRSQGGGEERSNLVSLCSVCHLDGVHLGRLKVVGSAPELTWVLGRTPVLRVDGRERE